MSGFMKHDWDLDKCKERVNAMCEEIQYSDLISNDKRLRGKRTFLKLTYLYSTANKRKFTIWEPRRGNKTTPQIKTVQQNYDRFHAFGVPETRNVVLMFTETEQASRDFLRYSKELKPGMDTVVILPRVDGQIVQSPLLKVPDPVLPIDTPLSNSVIVKPPNKVAQASYNFFDFVSRSVFVVSASPIDNTCSGALCDGQTGKSSCACTTAPPLKHWSLHLAFGCDEFDAVDRDEVSIISNTLTVTFIHENIRKWPLSNALLDPLDMDEAVSVQICLSNVCFQGFIKVFVSVLMAPLFLDPSVGRKH